MSQLIATFDWSRTPLGPMAEWPRNLKTMLNVCLHSRVQLAIYWGPDLILLYNDAEREVIGSLHPHALGKPAREVLVERWDTVGPMLHRVLETGEATWSVDRPLEIDRHGFLEKAYFAWSYSPIPGDVGGIGGVLLVTHETTERVLADRRLRTLKEMATETGGAESLEQACATAMRILGRNSEDVPFALLYVLDRTGAFTLVSSSGVSARPTGEQFLFEKARKREVVQIDNLARHFDAGTARGLTKTALILPVRESGLGNLAGFLVAGVNDHLQFDAAYQNFLDLLGSQIGTLMASARARDREHKLLARVQSHIELANRRRRAAERQRELRAEADRQRVLLEMVLNEMPAGVIIAQGPSGAVLRANRLAEEILEWPALHIGQIKDFSQVFRLSGRQYDAKEFPLTRSIQQGEIAIGEELQYLRPDGTFRILLANSAPVRDGEGKIVAGVFAFQDITDRQAAQQELLRQSHDVIHRLAGKLITAQEEERKRIARELHDDFAQRLSLLCIEMDALRRNHPAATDISDKLGDLVKNTEDVIESVRQISHRLHYSSLQLGLPRAAARYCREFSQSRGIEVKFAQTGQMTSLPEPIPLVMFRVLQEALSNVVKHSGADQVEVSLLFDDDAVGLRVKDRGRGFDTSQISDGLGLISMRERLRLVGGKITVTSSLGRGTELEATVPWSTDVRSR